VLPNPRIERPLTTSALVAEQRCPQELRYLVKSLLPDRRARARQYLSSEGASGSPTSRVEQTKAKRYCL